MSIFMNIAGQILFLSCNDAACSVLPLLKNRWFPSSYVEPYEVRSFSLLHGISLLF
eukprot:m.126901 g.126901  ORF g.126901 m.126901 type:complete len:56 (-) comp13845_c1_seq4:103-270(-)